MLEVASLEHTSYVGTRGFIDVLHGESYLSHPVDTIDGVHTTTPSPSPMGNPDALVRGVLRRRRVQREFIELMQERLCTELTAKWVDFLEKKLQFGLNIDYGRSLAGIFQIFSHSDYATDHHIRNKDNYFNC
jgi:hypothetical protein